MGAFDDILTRTPARSSVDNRPVTCRVVKVDPPTDDGWRRGWVVPLDGDMRVPIGPCRAGRHARVDDVVLLVWTDVEEPWILPDRPADAETAVPKTVFTAVGDLVVGTGPSACATLAPGGPGQVLTGSADQHIGWATRRDTGLTVLAAAGDVVGHPGLSVTARRVDNVVALHLVEASDATAAVPVTVAALPAGFRMTAPAGGVAAVAATYDPVAAAVAGTVVVLADGTVRLHAAGARNTGTVTGVTTDDWPT